MDNKRNKCHLVYLASNQTGLDIERFEITRLMAQFGMVNTGLACREDASPYNWEVSRSLIESADLFILLLGDDYGPMLPTGISYLHREFVHAKSLNKPVLAFVKNSIVGEPKNEDQRRLTSFHRTVMQQSAYKLWHLREELLLHVRAAISSNLLTIGPGWVPVNKVNMQGEDKTEPKKEVQITGRQKQVISRQILNLQVTSKVYQGGNLTLTESYVPSRLDLLFETLKDLLKAGASEDRLRKKIEAMVAENVKKEQLKKYPQAHAVDDVRLSRSQFQQILKSWHDLGLVSYSGSGIRVSWKLAQDASELQS